MLKYKIQKILSTHSFLSHQISIIMFSDAEANTYKGIGVFPIPISHLQESFHSDISGDYVGMPLVIDTEQALAFCYFIEDVISMKLPRKIIIYSTGPKLKIQFKKYIKNWHGGGVYKGYVTFGNFGLFSSSSVIIKRSLVKIRKSLIDLFNLENMLEIDV